MATSIPTLTDSEFSHLFEALVTEDPPPAPARPEWEVKLRSWRDFESDKTQADIYRAQERRVHGQLLSPELLGHVDNKTT